MNHLHKPEIPVQGDFWEDDRHTIATSFSRHSTWNDTPPSENFIIRHDHLTVRSDKEPLFLERLTALARSEFRTGFYLKQKELLYIRNKGLETIVRHAQDFIRTRLAPEKIPNDGKQTPMRGHPVFIAQHATGTCCRNCLQKWHGIPPKTALSRQQQDYIVTMIMVWIQKQMYP